jgi:hypothetical protein
LLRDLKNQGFPLGFGPPPTPLARHTAACHDIVACQAQGIDVLLQNENSA